MKSFPYFDIFNPLPPSLLQHILDGTLTWPHNITSLIGSEGMNFETLPRSLTHFSWNRNAPVFLPKSISILPRGLTSLYASTIKWNDIDVSTWPSTLTSLGVGTSLGFDVGCFHKLPRLLSDSRLTDDANDEDISSFDFDALCDIGRNSLATDPLWPSIKNEILARRSSSVPLEALESYVKSIESGRLFGLPLTLEWLQLPNMLLPTSAKLLLPPRVTDVQHQSCESSDHAHFWTLLLEALPPTTSADFELRMRETPEIKSLSAILPPTSNILSVSRLSSLKIQPAFPLTEDFFKNLPRTLTCLHFNHQFGASEVIPEYLQHLPPNLRELNIHSPLFNYALSSWVHYLPRALEAIYASSMAIIGCHIKDLPPDLTRLDCSFFEVSLPQVLDFPSKLAKLSVHHSGGREATRLRHCLIDKAWKTLFDAFRPFWRVREAGIHGMTVKLSIASKEWRLKPNACHTGAAKFIEDLLDRGSHPAPKDKKVDYTSANVAKFTKRSNYTGIADPRTCRRISGYE